MRARGLEILITVADNGYVVRTTNSENVTTFLFDKTESEQMIGSVCEALQITEDVYGPQPVPEPLAGGTPSADKISVDEI